jgi:hypothetical protein
MIVVKFRHKVNIFIWIVSEDPFNKTELLNIVSRIGPVSHNSEDIAFIMYLYDNASCTLH